MPVPTPHSHNKYLSVCFQTILYVPLSWYRFFSSQWCAGKCSATSSLGKRGGRCELAFAYFHDINTCTVASFKPSAWLTLSVALERHQWDDTHWLQWTSVLSSLTRGKAGTNSVLLTVACLLNDSEEGRATKGAGILGNTRIVVCVASPQ